MAFINNKLGRLRAVFDRIGSHPEDTICEFE